MSNNQNRKKLRIIISEECAKESHLLRDTILLPGSVPALLFFQDNGIDYELASNWLTKIDYNDRSLKSLNFCWNETLLSPNDPSLKGNLLFQHLRYPFYVNCMAVFLVGKAMGRIVDHYNIEVIEIEQICEVKNRTSQWEALYSTLYLEIAYHWAHFNNISIEFLPIFFDRDKDRNSDKKSMRNIISFYFSLFDLSFFILSAVTRKMFGDNRTVLFFQEHAGLVKDDSQPSNAHSISRLLAGFGRDAMPSNKFNDLFSSQSREILDLVVQKHGWAGKLLKYKLEESIDTFIREYQKSNVFFNYTFKILGNFKIKSSFLATCLYSGSGYFASAIKSIRQSGGIVTEVSHMPHYRIAKKMYTPHGLLIGPVDYVFHWGELMSGETGDRYLPESRHVKIGSPRSSPIERKIKHKEKARDGEDAILYAPSLLSIRNIGVSSIPWDTYAVTLERVFEKFSHSRHDIFVTYQASEGMKKIVKRWADSSIGFCNTKFINTLPNADYLVIDSLGGSPIFEALTSKLPILCHLYSQNLEWDEPVLKALKKRAVCCGDNESFLSELSDMLKCPKSYFEKKSADVNSVELLEMVVNPRTGENIWQTISKNIEATS